MRFICILLLSIGFVCIATPVSARTWYIKEDGSGDAPTIQAGIDIAQAGDDVLVEPGIYTWINQDASGTSMITMKSGVWLHSEAGAAATILNAEGLGRVVYCGEVDSQGIVEGFTITGGHFRLPSDDIGRGGGVLCSRSNVIIRDCVITGNEADKGGGIYFVYNSPTITGNTISDNVADSGGGIYCRLSSPTVTDNVIEANRAVEGDGGGIRCEFESYPEIVENRIKDNSAVFLGGGMACGVTTEVTITGNLIVGNEAFSGGGLYIGSDVATISENVIASNVSSFYGGGIYCTDDGAITITSNTIVSNDVGILGEGAGIYCFATTPTVSMNIISSSVGTACSHFGFGEAPVLTCNNMWDNRRGVGNCILGAGNFTDDPQFCGVSGSGNYFLQSDSPCAVGANGCGVQVGALGIDCDSTPTKTLTWGRLKSIYRD
jgi:predicted outer membrane repeat protein